jgi:hypothetical protein
MIRKMDPLRREGLPCFDLFVGLLLWGMRNVRGSEAAERGDEAEPVPAKALH